MSSFRRARQRKLRCAIAHRENDEIPDRLASQSLRDDRAGTKMTTLSPSGFLTVGASPLEYRMIGPSPESAPTIVMLHEGLGSTRLWGDFPDQLQAATGAGVYVYSRAG